MNINYEKAEIINSNDTMKGISMEYAIIRRRLGDDSDNWEVVRQELHQYKDRSYDIIIMTRVSSFLCKLLRSITNKLPSFLQRKSSVANHKEERCFCFDITSFYGK